MKGFWKYAKVNFLRLFLTLYLVDKMGLFVNWNNEFRFHPYTVSEKSFWDVQ